MNLDIAKKRALIEAMAATISAHAEALTALDSAIGDGDHGHNMKRGFEAVLADADTIAQKPLPEALKAIGTLLVMKVGGASGPLFGTLFLALAKEMPEAPDRANVARALGAAIEAVKARGKSDFGQKTLLDVLLPLHQTLEAGSASPSEITAIAAKAAEATIPVKAIRGRASFLGDRSIGHMDPGAFSTALLVAACCETLGG